MLLTKDVGLQRPLTLTLLEGASLVRSQRHRLLLVKSPTMDRRTETVAGALEQLAVSLGEAGAVPVAELVRALERAAERMRLRADPAEPPPDLVTQAEASRTVGVSRQAVNQWVKRGTLRAYDAGGTGERGGPRVSMSEVAIAANRRAPAQFSPIARRELLDFLDGIAGLGAGDLADSVRAAIDEEGPPGDELRGTELLQEFVVAAMQSGDRKPEFSPAGVRLLAELPPEFTVDPDTDLGHLAESLGLLLHASDGAVGFDSVATALLGLLGIATVGTLFSGEDTAVARAVARVATEVWGTDWVARLYDAICHAGGLQTRSMVRYTASLTYLDYYRFLRQAQASGVTISYARGPGTILPQRFYGAPIHNDILRGTRVESPVWAFTKEAAAAVGRPARNPSAVNPFRVFNYEYGLVDRTIYGIRRYCFSSTDARREFRATADSLPSPQRKIYLETAIKTLSRSLEQRSLELVAIDEEDDFDWWKSHIIRASEREIFIGLRDEASRRVSHALLVPTASLPDVFEITGADSSLRDRLRIYVKNLEFEVIDARYHDDLRRGSARMIKAGGLELDEAERLAVARAEINAYLE